MLYPVGLLTLALAAPAAAPSQHEAVPGPDKLEGRWKVVSVEAEGIRLPTEQVREVRLTFTGNVLSSWRGKQKQEEGTFRLDPSATPRVMRVAFTEGPNKGKTWPVLYALEGDTLRICGGEVGKGPPADFETRGKPGSLLLTLRRE